MQDTRKTIVFGLARATSLIAPYPDSSTAEQHQTVAATSSTTAVVQTAGLSGERTTFEYQGGSSFLPDDLACVEVPAEHTSSLCSDGLGPDSEQRVERGDQVRLLEQRPHAVDEDTEIELTGSSCAQRRVIVRCQSAISGGRENGPPFTTAIVRSSTEHNDAQDAGALEGRRLSMSLQHQNDSSYVVDPTALVEAVAALGGSAPASSNNHELAGAIVVEKDTEMLSGVGRGEELVAVVAGDTKSCDANGRASREKLLDVAGVAAAVGHVTMADRRNSLVIDTSLGSRKTEGNVLSKKQGEPQQTRRAGEQQGFPPEKLCAGDVAYTRCSSDRCHETGYLKGAAVLDQGLNDQINEHRDDNETTNILPTKGGDVASRFIEDTRGRSEIITRSPPLSDGKGDDEGDDTAASFIQEDDGSLGSSSFGKAAIDNCGGGSGGGDGGSGGDGLSTGVSRRSFHDTHNGIRNDVPSKWFF